MYRRSRVEGAGESGRCEKWRVRNEDVLEYSILSLGSNAVKTSGLRERRRESSKCETHEGEKKKKENMAKTALGVFCRVEHGKEERPEWQKRAGDARHVKERHGS